jgi:uncharacterized protein (TIGR00661 family)
MKILYALQGTGNGHISRASDILPILQNYGKVDVAVSGNQNEIQTGFTIKYHRKGLGFVFGKRGGIAMWPSIGQASLSRLAYEVYQFPVNDYDLVINDFEPVTAWACQFRKVPCIALGHQAALSMNDVPLAKVNDPLGKLIIQRYAPAHASVGFHFDTYNKDVFTPVIRNGIRNQRAETGSHYAVYLPAYDAFYVASLLAQIREVKWQIFSKRNMNARINPSVTIEPIHAGNFARSLASSAGVLCGAGFETPAESLFLHKKLLVVPMTGQYEQQCNANALELMGVPVIPKLTVQSLSKLAAWVASDKLVRVQWHDTTALSIERVFDKYDQLKGTVKSKLNLTESRLQKENVVS